LRILLIYVINKLWFYGLSLIQGEKAVEKPKEISLCPPVNKNLLKEITRRIVAKINPKKIILFGSYAHGKPNKDSDIDLFIIKETTLSSSKRFGLVSDALYPRLIPMDFIIKTPGEIKKRLKGFDPFIKDIMTRGKVLYENK